MSTQVVELIRFLAMERLGHLREVVIKECIPRWYTMTEAWRGQNRHAPTYSLRAVERKHVITIEWMFIKYWTNPSTGRRQRGFTSLRRGKHWAYDRASFRLADDGQWALIESIETEASQLRLEMMQIMKLQRYLRALDVLEPNSKR